MIDIYEAIGLLGTFLYLFSFAILQYKPKFSEDARYWYLNIAAAICVLFSLYFYWNLAAVIGNLSWLVVALFGLVRLMRAKQVGIPVASMDVNEIPVVTEVPLSQELDSENKS